MILIRIKYEGLSLLEVMLVLAIVSAILILGLRQYQTYQADTDVQQVKYNVDTLFLAATKYYVANCSNTWKSTGGTNLVSINNDPNVGTLDPTHNPPPSNPYIVLDGTISTLTNPNNGFLPESLMLINPIVDRSEGFNGYYVQFNRYDSTRMIKVSNAAGVMSDQSAGTIVNWRIQVTVKLNNASMANQYKQLLLGNCLVSSSTATCASGSGSGSYVVFERLPSLAFPGMMVDDLFNPITKQFKQSYTTYPILDITSGAKTQYYLCGS